MWAAGAVAAMSSITFPAVSALISRTADPDQQGRLFIRSDSHCVSNQTGPLNIFLSFPQAWVRAWSRASADCATVWVRLFTVSSSTSFTSSWTRFQTRIRMCSTITIVTNRWVNIHELGFGVNGFVATTFPDSSRFFAFLQQSAIIPGPPFLFGACSVLLALLVALFIPEHPHMGARAGSWKKHTSPHGHPHSPHPPGEAKEPLLQDTNVWWAVRVQAWRKSYAWKLLYIES